MSRSAVRRRQAVGLVYILPWIVGFLVLQLYPFIASFIYSFTNFNLGGTPDFIGLKNYVDIFTKDAEFWNSLKVTIIFVFVSVPCKLVFALFIAILLNQKVRGVNLFRTVYYLPSIFGSSVAISIVWRMLFQTDGIVNSLLKNIHLPTMPWLGEPTMALMTLCLLSVWQFGSSMVIFLAGLKQIPSELYDAAKVDGASVPRTFFTITIPMLTPMVFFNIIMQMINAFQEFTSAFVITDGGPMHGTYVYGLKLYNEAFRYFKIGYSSALSWILFIVIMLFTAVLFASSKKWVHYEDGGR